MSQKTKLTRLLNVTLTTKEEPVRRRENQKNHPEMYAAMQEVQPQLISARLPSHQAALDEQAGRTAHLQALLQHSLPAQAHAQYSFLLASYHPRTSPPPSPSSP